MSAKKKYEGLEEVFALKLKEGFDNVKLSDNDLLFYRNKFNISKNVPIAVFNSSGIWVETY